LRTAATKAAAIYLRAPSTSADRSSDAASIRLMPVIFGVDTRNTLRRANVRVRAIAIHW